MALLVLEETNYIHATVGDDLYAVLPDTHFTGRMLTGADASPAPGGFFVYLKSGELERTRVGFGEALRGGWIVRFAAKQSGGHRGYRPLDLESSAHFLEEE